MIRPNQRIITTARDLAACEQLILDGKYYAANDKLRRLHQDIKLRHLNGTVWEYQVLIQTAKAKFHLGQTSSAIEILIQIDEQALLGFPDLLVEYANINGLIRLRQATALLLAEKPHSATAKSNEAIRYFQLVEEIATGEALHLQKRNAKLNMLYAQGKIASINGRSKEVNPSLIVAMVENEHSIRQHTPPIKRNDMTGTVMISHMTVPLNLSIDECRELDIRPDYQGACLAVFGSPCGKTWPEHLLGLARDINLKPGAKASGLVLGASMLCKQQYQYLLPKLKFSYQFLLAEASRTLQNETQRETWLVKRIRAAIRQLDEVTGSRPFNDAKVFG